MEYDYNVVTHLSAEEWEKYVGGMLRLNMGEIEGKAKGILDMVEAGKLIMEDVKVDEAESRSVN